MTKLAYTELLALADGSYTTVERQIEVPEGRIFGENVGQQAYFPLEGVTLDHGTLWHWEPAAATEAEHIRVLSDAEVKKIAKRGVIRSKALKGDDPITGIGLADLETAEEPIPQVPSERVLAEVEA
jgi:hypothetical protein